ncbi:MAG: hypothetical protein AAGF83_10575 [Cyanobacteria bacterium P01_G01_bin.67]
MKQAKFLLSILTGTIVLGTIWCQAVLADQCAYISKQQALNAISRLDVEQFVYLLCEPCGEKVPQVAKIQNLAMEKVDYQDYWQVKINNQGIDLAYVFIDSGIEGNLVNLAAISDCQASRVSTMITPPTVE